MTNVHETIWKPILGFEGAYEISNTGLVKSVSRIIKFDIITTDGIMRPRFDKDCYLAVSLCKDGKKFSLRIHRLVAAAFVENPLNLPIPDHLNGVRWDNRAANLHWKTQSDNILSAFEFGRKVCAGKAIYQLTIDGVFVKRFEKISYIEKDGFKSKGMKRYLTTGKPYMGFLWRYA